VYTLCSCLALTSSSAAAQWPKRAATKSSAKEIVLLSLRQREMKKDAGHDFAQTFMTPRVYLAAEQFLADHSRGDSARASEARVYDAQGGGLFATYLISASSRGDPRTKSMLALLN
jgi:hypothetical protein